MTWIRLHSEDEPFHFSLLLWLFGSHRLLFLRFDQPHLFLVVPRRSFERRGTEWRCRKADPQGRQTWYWITRDQSLPDSSVRARALSPSLWLHADKTDPLRGVYSFSFFLPLSFPDLCLFWPVGFLCVFSLIFIIVLNGKEFARVLQSCCF